MKILHQVWVQGEAELPEAYRRNRALWRKLLPEDWQMVLWDEKMALEQWPELIPHFPKCFHHATRCDLILARALRDIGGIATGTDVIPINVPHLLKWCEINGTLVVLNMSAKSCSNGLSFSVKPGHPFWERLCTYQLRGDGNRLGDSNIWSSTGPGAHYNP